MTVVIIAVVAVVLVLVVGLIIFRLMKGAQTTVPSVADDARRTGVLVVGQDEQGAVITEAQEPPAAVRDERGFESLLRDEISDRGMEQPAADDEA